MDKVKNLVKRIPFLKNSFNAIYYRIQRQTLPFFVTLQGFKMKRIPFQVYRRGIHEPETTRLFQKIIKPGMVVLDVGAQYGYYTLLFSSLVGPEGKVIAIEPDKISSKRLRENISRNGVNNVIIHSVAASNRSGSAQFYYALPGSGVNSLIKNSKTANVTEVDVATIDSLIEGRVDIIKVDAEGVELDVLRGAQKSLTSKPAVILEFSSKSFRSTGQTASEFLRALRGMGFRYHFINEDGSVSYMADVSLLEMEAVRGHINLYCTL